jgi:hypothetical protein
MNHAMPCTECRPATTENPVCVPCPRGRALWARYRILADREDRAAAQADDWSPGPSIYPQGGTDQFHDED